MNELSSVARILKLVKLQSQEKIKVFNFRSLKGFIFSLIIKIALVVGIAYVINLMLSAANAFAGFQISKELLAFILIIFSAITFLSCLFNSLNSLYNAKDNQFLLHLPVTPNDVFISKLLLLLFQEIISGILIILPLLSGFTLGASNAYFGSNNMDINAWFILSCVFLTILLPIVVSILAVLISLPFKMLVQLIKKNRIAVLLSFFVIISAFIWIFNMVVSAIIGSINFFNQLGIMLHNVSAFMKGIAESTWLFLQIAISTNTANMLLTCLFLLVAAVGMLVPVYFIIKPTYLRLAISGGESTKKEAKQGRGFRLKRKRGRNSFISIMRRDIEMLTNNSADVFQYFIVFLAMPFVILLINRLLSILELNNIANSLILAANIMMIAIFSLIGNMYSATAISREGGNFYLVKTTPVSYAKQSYAKIMVNFLISAMFILITCLELYFITELTLGNCLLAFVLISVLSFGHICLSYEKDLKSPHTDWYDESEIKKNKNISYSLTSGLLVALAFGLFAFKFLIMTDYIKTLIYLTILATVFTVYRIYSLNHKIKFYIANHS